MSGRKDTEMAETKTPIVNKVYVVTVNVVVRAPSEIKAGDKVISCIEKVSDPAYFPKIVETRLEDEL